MGKISFRSSIEQGILGFIDTGFPVFLINLISGTINSALWAWFYQGLVTFFAVTINTVVFQFLYFRNYKFLSVLIPTSFTTFLSFLVHSKANSPEPFFSAFFVFIIALWYFLLLVYFEEKFGTIGVLDLCRIFINWIKKKLN